jgi:hypothetical protein
VYKCIWIQNLMARQHSTTQWLHRSWWVVNNYLACSYTIRQSHLLLGFYCDCSTGHLAVRIPAYCKNTFLCRSNLMRVIKTEPTLKCFKIPSGIFFKTLKVYGYINITRKEWLMVTVCTSISGPNILAFLQCCRFCSLRDMSTFTTFVAIYTRELDVCLWFTVL